MLAAVTPTLQTLWDKSNRTPCRQSREFLNVGAAMTTLGFLAQGSCIYGGQSQEPTWLGANLAVQSHPRSPSSLLT